MNRPQDLQADLFLYTDGGFSQIEDRGSTGFCVFDPAGNLLSSGKKAYYPVISSTQAELLAMRDGLQLLQNLPDFETANVIALITDSQAIVRGFHSWCTETGRKLSPLQAEIMDLLALDEGQYYIQWTRGHTNELGNTIADELASEALISTIANQIPLETGYFQRRGRQILLEPPQEAPRLSHLKRQDLPRAIIRSIRKAPSQLRTFIERIATNHFRDRFPGPAPIQKEEVIADGAEYNIKQWNTFQRNAAMNL